jgi:hypothetical protein
VPDLRVGKELADLGVERVFERYKQSGLGCLDGIAFIDDFIKYKTIVHEVDLNPNT